MLFLKPAFAVEGRTYELYRCHVAVGDCILIIINVCEMHHGNFSILSMHSIVEFAYQTY